MKLQINYFNNKILPINIKVPILFPFLLTFLKMFTYIYIYFTAKIGESGLFMDAALNVLNSEKLKLKPDIINKVTEPLSLEAPSLTLHLNVHMFYKINNLLIFL